MPDIPNAVAWTLLVLLLLAVGWIVSLKDDLKWAQAHLRAASYWRTKWHIRAAMWGYYHVAQPAQSEMWAQEIAVREQERAA